MNTQIAMKSHIRRTCLLLQSVLLLFCFAGVWNASAQQSEKVEKFQLKPGRYVLIVEGTGALDPVIFEIAPTKAGYKMTPEDQRYAESTITEDSGSFHFALTRTPIRDVPQPFTDAPKKYLQSFVGIPSESSKGAIEGPYSSIYYYFHGGQPSGAMGRFLLLPVDKK